MKKRLLALLLVFAMLLPVFNVTAFANDGTSTPEKQYSVTVYFSLTDDGSILNGLGLKKMTVPYFDLANYGLDQFYFSREDYNQYPGWSEIDPSHPKSDLTPGTFVAMPGLPGVEYSDYICCTPGGIRLVVQ